MSDDLQLFDEDAREQLDFMEAALVNMQDVGVNDEDIGALFRAMHTIKGTAGMFGFDDVVGFAHIAENLLSDVREGKIVLTESMLDIFLLARDHTKNLIQAAVEEREIDTELKQTNFELLEKLLEFMPNSELAEGAIDTPTQSETVSAEPTETLWHLSLNFEEDFFSSGMDVLNILTFLDDMGSIKHIWPQRNKIPVLEEIKPTQTYISFQVQLLTQQPLEEIEEVFEFIEDDMDLDIFKSDDTVSLDKLIAKMDDKDFEKDLVTQGFYDASVFEPVKVEEEAIEVPTKENHPQRRSTDKVVESAKSFSLRVDSSKVDHLMNQISEMVIANAKIAQKTDAIDDTELSEAATIMGDLLETIRSSVMNIRMIQVGDSFAKFRRIVNDTAKKIGKDINFTINGGETELDKMVVEKISDPLMHMLRNSVDHGVEMPNERESKSKARQGQVTLSAYPDSGTIVIEIKDDGKGLDKDALLKKAITQGIVSENDKLSDKEIYQLVFAAGLSTAKEVSDISGRGVGMDVVKRNIADLRGTIDIDSKLGEGTTFTIRLPLTLAIIDGFLIQAGETKYIIPLDMIQECIELNASYKAKMNGNMFINLRNNILPLLDIREYFNEKESNSKRENVVVVQYGEYKMGMLVDELFGEFQTVIKPLGEIFANVNGISGGTILGGGEIGLIFDVPKLMEQVIREGLG